MIISQSIRYSQIARRGLFSLGISLILLFGLRHAAVGQTIAPGQTAGFAGLDDCDATPFADTPLFGVRGACVHPNRVESFAMLSVSAINRDVESYATAIMRFDVSDADTPAVLDATVSADVEWNGVLFGAGILGAGAAVEVEMSLVDETTGATKGRVQVFEKSQDSTGLKGVDVGGTVFSGSKRVSFTGSVVRGNAHSIRVTVTCKAQSGLVGLDVGCVFDPNSFGLGLGDRYVRWNRLTITVEQDELEVLSRLEQKIDALSLKLDTLLSGQDELKAGQTELKAGQAELSALQLEVIRLLNTPQGLRDKPDRRE